MAEQVCSPGQDGHSCTCDRRLSALREHWPEYLMEAILLGALMVASCVYALILDHPGSPVHQGIGSPLLRRMLMGLLMGATVVACILNPLGQRSGAHMNPAVTLAFFRLGRIAGWDAAFYILAQFFGGAAGVALIGFLVGPPIADPAVRHVATLPGLYGFAAAWAGEFLIAFLLMLTVLAASNHRRLTGYTPWFAGLLVALYITFEAPISGMSMNPARTFASAFNAWLWQGIWIYFTAPPLAMLAAGEIYLRTAGAERVFCAKLHHANGQRCIFRCRFGELMRESQE